MGCVSKITDLDTSARGQGAAEAAQWIVVGRKFWG